MTDQPTLFDPARTVDTACPVGHCQAIRFAAQDGRIPTCAHDLEPEPGRRPRGCLNRAPDPATAPIPF